MSQATYNPTLRNMTDEEFANHLYVTGAVPDCLKSEAIKRIGDTSDLQEEIEGLGSELEDTIKNAHSELEKIEAFADETGASKALKMLIADAADRATALVLFGSPEV